MYRNGCPGRTPKIFALLTRGSADCRALGVPSDSSVAGVEGRSQPVSASSPAKNNPGSNAPRALKSAIALCTQPKRVLQSSWSASAPFWACRRREAGCLAFPITVRPSPRPDVRYRARNANEPSSNGAEQQDQSPSLSNEFDPPE